MHGIEHVKDWFGLDPSSPKKNTKCEYIHGGKIVHAVIIHFGFLKYILAQIWHLLDGFWHWQITDKNKRVWTKNKWIMIQMARCKMGTEPIVVKGLLGHLWMAENTWVTGVISPLYVLENSFPWWVPTSLPECQYGVLTSYKGPFKWKISTFEQMGPLLKQLALGPTS